MTATLTTPNPPPRTDGPAAVPPKADAAERSLRVLGLPAFRAGGNPYNRLLCNELVAAGAIVEDYNWRRAMTEPWDIVHLHWPEYMLASRKAPWLSRLRRFANLSVLRRLKQRGAKVCWTVHNLKPHGMAADTAWGPYNEFLELVDGCLYLSHGSRRLFQDRYPAAADKPGFVMPHGVFDGVYPNTATTAEARRRLGIPAGATVAAAIGGIHRYKNLAALVREHTRLGRKDLWLVIAGKPADADLAAELVDAAAGRSDVVLQLRFIPDDRLQDYFMAADFCVAPYEDILNSGAVMLAISFGRPVVCPAIGSLVELQQAVGDGWVRTYDGPFNAGVLADAAEWSRSPRPPKPEIAAMQWDSIAQQTLAAYRELIGIGSKPPRFTP